MRNQDARRYKMIVTFDIDTDRLIDIFCAAAFLVIVCIAAAGAISGLLGDAAPSSLPDYMIPPGLPALSCDQPCPPAR